MERLIFRKSITAIIFVVLLFTFSIINFITEYKPLKEMLSKGKSSELDEIIKNADSTINDNVYGKYSFIESYGYLQKLMNKNEENNFETIKDNNGFLHYTFFGDQANPVYTLVEKAKSFRDGLKDKNTKFIYLMPPDKFIRGYTKLPIGIPYNYANETADKFLDLLNANNIKSIDLRENLDKSGIDPSELFFKTDHHWKTETAFWEFGQLVEKLKKDYGLKVDPSGFYTNKDNYNFITYKDSFIGSMGRKTGMYYSGVDDFTLIYPKFKTSYTYYSKTGEQETKLEGKFEEALITVSPFRTEKGKYALEADKYSSYLFGNQGIVHVTNKNNQKGPKVLLIKDSFSVPLAAFLSTVCSDVYLVDPRYYNDNILEYANSIDTDFIFMAFSPQDLTEEFFRFDKVK